MLLADRCFMTIVPFCDSFLILFNAAIVGFRILAAFVNRQEESVWLVQHST